MKIGLLMKITIQLEIGGAADVAGRDASESPISRRQKWAGGTLERADIPARTPAIHQWAIQRRLRWGLGYGGPTSFVSAGSRDWEAPTGTMTTSPSCSGFVIVAPPRNHAPQEGSPPLGCRKLYN